MRFSIIAKSQLVSVTLRIVVTVAIMFGSSNANLAVAQPPGAQADALWGYSNPASYKILPRPSPVLSHHATAETNRFTPPTLVTRPTTPYSYGWFGTRPSPHWHRQFGSQSAHTQWTLR